MSKSKSNDNGGTIALNKKARHDYFIQDRYEAGIALLGWEVKSLRAGRTNVRAEYLIRRTDMYAAEQERFEYALQPQADGTLPERTFQVRDGWYVEVEQPVLRNLDVILRWDGMRRRGNTAPGSAVDFEAGVSRWTLGAQYVIERGYRLKASAEHYSWWGMRPVHTPVAWRVSTRRAGTSG